MGYKVSTLAWRTLKKINHVYNSRENQHSMLSAKPIPSEMLTSFFNEQGILRRIVWQVGMKVALLNNYLELTISLKGSLVENYKNWECRVIERQNDWQQVVQYGLYKVKHLFIFG